MSVTAAVADPVLDDALFAATLAARDPRAFGGILVCGGEARQAALIEMVTAALPAAAPVRRLPAHADLDRLVGGLDLGAALAGEGARLQRGLLGESDGGVLIVPAANRLAPEQAAALGAALDRGEIAVERDGLAASQPARIAVLAFDERGAEEPVPAALADRLAFHLDLDAAPVAGGTNAPVEDLDALTTLAVAATALGIASARAPLFALRTARASARAAGRAGLTEADVARAVRLVLAPRATQLPPASEEAAPPPPDQGQSETPGESEQSGTLEDRVLDAVIASLPADLFDERGGVRRGAAKRARGAGERRRSPTRGRPAGVRAGTPGGGRRLALVETLRAAAPWQGVRGRTDRVLVRKGDLRVRRFEARAEQLTILAVDASGSAAMARLAEAKGAVELLLARAYVARAEVALIAFRGSTAEILLPPTRSLARARRALAELPGGGGTPLAAGLAAAHGLALAAKARGRTPFLVLLSDGRGNIAADGSPGRPAAERDALAAARAIAADGLAAAFIDTGARARPEGARLADAMRARYVPLPHAGAGAIDGAIATLAPR